jgi:hypothetical protein
MLIVSSPRKSFDKIHLDFFHCLTIYSHAQRFEGTWINVKTMGKVQMYKVVQILPGQTVTCLHTNSPGHI